MKKVLISGYIGFGNFGDELIFDILKNHLQNMNCEVVALSVSDKYDIKTYRYKYLPDIIKAILGCDILISGGGSLLQNKTSSFSLLYYLSIIFLAKLFFKKVIIFAQGIEKINGQFYKALAKNILKLCDFVSVRDKNSKALLDSWNIKSTLLSDPAYSIVDTIKTCENKRGLLLQLRDFKGIKKEISSDLAKIISKYFDEVNVVSFQREYDEEICFNFINEFKKIGKKANYIYNENIGDTVNLINNSEYIISTRLHGLIVGTICKSKVFALSYDDKIKTLVNEFGIKNIDLFKYNFDELDEKLKLFFNSKQDEIKVKKFDWEEIDKEVK